MCSANAVLQLLVHSRPFWELFRELGDLKESRGAGVSETSDDATRLVDATLKFFEEFMLKEEPPPPQQPLQQIAGGKLREDEDATKEHDAVDSFEPTYIYDAMKEKRQLKAFLVCFAS
jgi:ubiquitin carboxyl-terminal hydrolase 10